MLYNKFVIVLIYKVIGNTSFLFEKFYAEILINERDLNNVNNNIATYMKGIKRIDKIFSN